VTVRKENAEAVTRERLIQHCSQHLVLFKVPQVYEFKDNLTISATGKKIKKV
jgi:acyl-CoA synthetase (AMP-forming)/AMP-acid ligase II